MRHLNWQPLLLIIATLLSISFAIGGWALGRRRSQPHQAKTKAPARTDEPAPDVLTPSAKTIAAADSSGVISLVPLAAALAGQVQLTQTEGEPVLTGWSSPDDAATWQFRATRPGFYNAQIEYAATDTAADAELELRVGVRKRLCSLRASGGLDRFITDEYPIAVQDAGQHQIAIRSNSQQEGSWLVVRSVRLIPVGADKLGRSP